MPELPIPFTPNEAPGTEVLAGGGVVSMNVIQESSKAVRRRPGITTHAVAPGTTIAPAPVVGLYSTVGSEVYAVLDIGAERPIYRVSAGAAAALGGGLSPTGLLGTERPMFAETEALLVIAGGNLIQKIELATQTSSRLGGNPPQASHVIANASRLLANDLITDRSALAFSGVAAGTITYAGHEQWSLGVGTAGFVSAEGRPDPVLAVHENTGEVYVFGSTTLQVFAADTSFVYAPVSTIERGISAPYSVVKFDQFFMWLDERRRFVASDGRSDETISRDIETILDEMVTVADCFGYRVTVGQFDVAIWTFPTDGRTFVYQKGVGWGQWSGFSSSWMPFPVTACVQTSNECLVGTSDGFVGQLSLSSSTDRGDPINAYIETGYISRGTERQKHCRSVRIALRRGRASGSTAPVGFLRYRDRPGPWVVTIPISLGASGDTDIVLQFHSLGVYRRRQWSFEFSGTDDLVLVSAVESYEELEN